MTPEQAQDAGRRVAERLIRSRQIPGTRRRETVLEAKGHRWSLAPTVQDQMRRVLAREVAAVLLDPITKADA